MKPLDHKTVNKRMDEVDILLNKASDAYKTIIDIGGPRLEATEEGHILVEHARTEVLTLFRAKATVLDVRIGVKKRGWLMKRLRRWLKDNPELLEKVKQVEKSARDFFNDSMKSTVYASELCEITHPSTIYPATDPNDKLATFSAMIATLAIVDGNGEEKESKTAEDEWGTNEDGSEISWDDSETLAPES